MKNIYFCDVQYRKKLTARQVIIMNHANLLVRQLGIVPSILTASLNLHEQEIWQRHQQQGRVHRSIPLINLYDELLQIEQGRNLPAYIPTWDSAWQVVNVEKNKRHQRVYHPNGRLRMYLVWRDKERTRLNYINYFHGGRKIQRDRFNRYGQLALVQYLGEKNRVIREDGFTPMGQRCLSRIFRQDGQSIRLIQYYNHDNQQYLCFDSEKALAQHWLGARFQETKALIFFLSGHQWWRTPLKQSGLHNIYAGRSLLEQLFHLYNEKTRPMKEEKNIIGLLSYPRTPFVFFEANEIAKKAYEKGLKVFYLPYRAWVETKHNETSLVNGFLYEGQWRYYRGELPKIVDNAPARNKNEEVVLNYVKKHTHILCHRIGGKHKVLSLLNNHAEIRPYLLDSEEIKKENFDSLFQRFPQVIIKPFSSNRGQHVFLVKRLSNHQFLLTDDKQVKEVSKEYLYKKTIDSDRQWMVQQYVYSRTVDQRPFDIRVPMFRGKNGQWQSANMYARVGQGKLTSNLATGGESVDGYQFLMKQFSEALGKTLYLKLQQAANNVVQALQNYYDFEIDALGCDFGIENEAIYLFEVNSYPGLLGCYQTAIPIKVDYYHHLLENKAIV